MILIVTVSIIVLAYNLDLFGIKTAIENSNFYNRFNNEYSQDVTEDSRFESKLFFLKSMLGNLWGGGTIRASYGLYAHDLYFDTFDDFGIFAFLFIILYIISSIIRMIKCLKSKNIPFHTKQLIFCVYVIANIQFWLEPIMAGMPWLLAFYCIIDGTVATLLFYENESSTIHWENSL